LSQKIDGVPLYVPERDGHIKRPEIGLFSAKKDDLLILSDLTYHSCFLILPVSSGLKWPVEFYGTGPRAVICAATAVPAFIRVKNNGRFSLFGVGNIDIYLANLNAVITPVAYFRVKNDRLVWRDNIGHCHDLFV
jgi:hypothetical protein